MCQAVPQEFQGVPHLGLDCFDENALDLRNLGIGQVIEVVHRKEDSGLLGERFDSLVNGSGYLFLLLLIIFGRLLVRNR